MAAALGHTDIIRQLLKAGAKPMVLDTIGNSPIMLACLHGRQGAAECLLQVNVDINTGETLPVHVQKVGLDHASA